MALANREAYTLAVSDIVEPVKEWREAKFALTQREWDYVFRRLFYAWTPDITTTPFTDWVEIANQERTAGHIFNLDIWLAADGAAHLLWLERTLDTRLRERFFANEVLEASLKHGVVRSGRLVSCDTLLKAVEGASEQAPTWGRFHATPEGRLFVFYSLEKGNGAMGLENRLIEISAKDGRGETVQVDLAQPFTSFFMTTTERGGSPPSRILEVLGRCSDSPLLHYARIKLC